jgi:hypothetical protein
MLLFLGLSVPVGETVVPFVMPPLEEEVGDPLVPVPVELADVSGADVLDEEVLVVVLALFMVCRPAVVA